jgi:hypothetical protein
MSEWPFHSPGRSAGTASRPSGHHGPQKKLGSLLRAKEAAEQATHLKSVFYSQHDLEIPHPVERHHPACHWR